MLDNPFKKFTANGGIWDEDDQAIHVTSPHLLTQISGYSKFISGAGRKFVSFRGQTQSFGAMKPSLYRIKEHHTFSTIAERHERIKKYTLKVIQSGALIKNTPERAVEPLLQHYGMRTRWLDLVDNIWVALWFACYRAVAAGRLGEFVNFERRSMREGESATAYIMVMAFDRLQEVDKHPGFTSNGDYEVVDLRVAVPSLYLRPHAQHGLLFRRRKVEDINHTDYSDAIFGTIRVSLADALNWLGSGELLNAHTIFPPPTYDAGYRFLLETAPEGHEHIGTISMVGT